MKNSDKNLLSEKGQAIFELIVFLPLLLLILTVMVTVGNAISSSINQQKVTRGYFYYILRGNSQGINSIDLKEYSTDHGMTNVGMFSIGWRRSEAEQSDDQVFATCFRFSPMFSADNSDENCDEPNLGSESKTSIIRLYTAYGICSDVYSINQEGDLVANPLGRTIAGLCSIRQ